MTSRPKAAPAGVPGPQPWDRAAHGWDRHTSQINAWLLDATDAMLAVACVVAGSRVLDVAAGAGGQTAAIARLTGDTGYVLATDVSVNAVALARANVLSAGLPNVETRVADAQALGLAGAGFDAAVCRLGLMFCEAPGNALAGMAAALKPGGRLAALVFAEPERNPCTAILMSTALKHAALPASLLYQRGSLFSLADPALLARLLEQSGFANVAVQRRAAPFRMPSTAHYLDFVRSSGSPVMELLRPLPERVQAEAWADMAGQLDAYTVNEGWVGPHELLLCGGTSACH